jgi:hypothetical protein
MEQQGLTQDPRDKTGKTRVQETSRPLGHDTYFSSVGDDISSPTNVGDGQRFMYDHIAGLTILHVSRASNIATVQVSKAHGINPGDKVDVTCVDSSYNVVFTSTGVVLSVPAPDTITYANTGTDDAGQTIGGAVVCRTAYLYIDLNMVENDTWLHEGYITWKDMLFDHVTFRVVPIVTSVVPGSNTNFNLYGPFIVAAPGNGTVQLTKDMSGHRDGLVYMPNDDLNNPPGVNGQPPAFWDATWNTTTKKFENLAFNPLGQGRYNMFPAEVPLSRFVNQITPLGQGFIMLQSADSAQLGQGMRLKVTLGTHGDDHAWQFSCVMTLHRKKTV